MTSSSSGDFVRRSSFTSAEPVTTRSGASASVRWSSGLGPDAIADREPPGVAHADRRRLEQRRSVVTLGDDDDLAGQLSGKVEQGHHPRQDEHGIAVGSEEGSSHPAMRVLRLAEGRDRHARRP